MPLRFHAASTVRSATLRSAEKVEYANWLASLVDAAILVLTWSSTKESEVWDAASSLRLHQAPLIGTVINEVNPRLQSRFGLGKVVQ